MNKFIKVLEVPMPKVKYVFYDYLFWDIKFLFRKNLYDSKVEIKYAIHLYNIKIKNIITNMEKLR